MKKVFLTLLWSFALSTGLFAQKMINDANAEKRSASGFYAIEVGGGIDLYLSQGNEAVAVSAADTKSRDRIQTEVKNGVLKIWVEYNSNIRVQWGNKKLRAYVSFNELDRLNASGGSDVYTDGSIKTTKLDIGLSGGSDFKGAVDIADLKVVASGGSDVKISGASGNLTIHASGGSDFKGYDLVTDNCELKASGGSDVYITVNKTLKAEASGGSDVYYKGNGTLTESKSGGSDIKKVS